MPIAKAMLAALLMSTLSSCSTTLHIPASVNLCKTLELNGWKIWSQQGGRYQTSIDDVTYDLDFSDLQRGLANTIQGTPVFWIELDGFTVGRAVGSKTTPMFYEPGEATMTIHGTTVHALPKVWGTRLDIGRFRPANEMTLPIDLNAVEKGQLGSGHFFIAFPIQPPLPTDTYTVTPGTLMLGIHPMKWPLKESCYTPEQVITQPFTFHPS